MNLQEDDGSIEKFAEFDNNMGEMDALAVKETLENQF